MNIAQSPSQPRQCIHLAFEEQRLESLIRDGKLHASDFNCLEQASRHVVWRVVLAAAARTSHP